MKRIISLVLLITLLSFSGCAGSVQWNKQDISYKPISVGETVKGERLCFTFDKAICNKELPGQYGVYTADEGKSFLALYFSIENTSEKTMSISVLIGLSATVDGEKTSFSMMTDRDMYPDFDGIVEPNSTRKGCLVYQVPDTWQSISVVYKDASAGETAEYHFEVAPAQTTKK